MMIRTIGLAGLAIAMLASTAARAADSEAPKDDKDRKICRSIKVTGSRLNSQRVCYTKAEWDAMERQAREDSARVQNNAQSGFARN